MIKKFTFLIIFSLGLSAVHAQQKVVDNSTALANGPTFLVAKSDDSRVMYHFNNFFTWIDIPSGTKTTTASSVSSFGDAARVGDVIFFRGGGVGTGQTELMFSLIDDNDITFLNYYTTAFNYPKMFTQDGLGNYYGVGKFDTDNAGLDFIKLGSDMTTVIRPFNNRLGNTNDFIGKSHLQTQIVAFADDKVLARAYSTDGSTDLEYFVYDAGDDVVTQITDPNDLATNVSSIGLPVAVPFGTTEVAFYQSHVGDTKLSVFTTDGTTLSEVAEVSTVSGTSFAATTTEILWADTDGGDEELYYSTGTGSTKVDVNTSGSSAPRNFVSNGANALFVADDGSGNELYSYSGSGSYSKVLYDGSPIPFTPYTSILRPTIEAAGNGFVFFADLGSGEKVFFSDGTNTVLLDQGYTYDEFIQARDNQTYITAEYYYFADNDKDIIRVAIPDNIYTGGAFTQTVVDGQDHFFDDSYTFASGVVTANNLTISSGNTVTIADGATLVLEDLFSTGSIVVESGGSLVINGDTYGTGTVTATRRTTFNESTGQYSVVGSPMTAATTTVLGASAQVYSYNETLAYGTARFEEAVAGSAMTPGVGYFSAFTGDSNGDITFTGTPNTGDIDVDLSYSSADANDGYNLVSNPYLAAISLSQLATDNAANIDGNFYIWDDNNPQGTQGTDADYITVNNSGVVSNNSDGAKGTGFDGNIRSGQGFFVKASSASTLTFSPSQMINGSNGSDYFFRADGGVDFTRFKVSVSGVGGYNETLLAFRDHATNAFDIGMDGLKLAGSGVQLFSYMGEERYAIQTLHSSSLYDAKIDLGVLVSEAGSYSFNIAEVENLPDGLEIVLTHVDTTEEYVLSDGQIELSLNASADAQSFTVSLRAAAVLALDNPNSNNLVVYNSGNSLNINFADDTSLIDFDVFTISGQRVLSARNEQVYANTWKGNVTLSQGHIYIIKIRSEGSVFSQKFIY